VGETHSSVALVVWLQSALRCFVIMDKTHSSVALVVWLQSVLRCFVIMDEKRRLVCLYLLYRRHRRKSLKCRKYWVFPLLMQRYEIGAFQTLYEELRNDEKNILIVFVCLQSSVTVMASLQ
jgi:hypothetical protein